MIVKRFYVSFLVWLIAMPVASAASWTLFPERCNDVDIQRRDQVIEILTTGNDPYLVGELSEIGAEDAVLQFDYFCVSGIEQVELFLGRTHFGDTPLSLPSIPVAEAWQTYSTPVQLDRLRNGDPAHHTLRIDLGQRPGVRIQLRNVHMRGTTPQEKQREANQQQLRQQKIIQAERIRSYLSQSFPAKIDSVVVDQDTLTISFSALPTTLSVSDVQLIECPPWQSISQSVEPTEVEPTKVDVAIQRHDRKITMRLPRFDGQRDRLQSGWRLTRSVSGQSSYLTPRAFATEINVVGDNHAPHRPVPANQKGLGGIGLHGPIEELKELGVTAITVNIAINAFVKDSPGQGRINIPTSGEPVYFDTLTLSHYDRVMNWARENNVVVSAIILIPTPRVGKDTSPLVHPDNDGGIYTMPDLTTRRGSDIYAFVISEIARRYSNTDAAPGGISNWIAHNEIDFHTVWTNMGLQPREIVTETYYRSMRIIHNAARQSNPHARVFASLTHHFNVPDDGQWRQLSGREVIQSLQRYSVLEGDFAWGVAYHPYPQNLFASVPWNDTRISDDFDTPLVTIQNLQVFGRFMQQESMRDPAGRIRPVLFSEQGFHTDSYDADAQDRQAAALRYAMKKVHAMPMVESFHYHRWIDHPDEGGLMLGLRTLPSEAEPYGKRKRAWEVYQAIGTEREEQVSQGLPTP
ncbi:hypothetical protein Pla52o_29030 [Novipirellula galeiformis]|uniref:DUF5722 domain-containing protein n=1 Tax=Novipirellula galeiformis TaxID=2528004 RepID=A0A5C6CI54_9BACT|nr:DUF5722 domain-containing protein [Novipirellula galeiformis]TWU23367.1 hypothetical protein Pla52o_29030 [Novipirellula galeiformis]